MFQNACRVLEIGPDKSPSSLRLLVGNDSIQWDTLDLYPNASLTHVAVNEYTFPIPDNQYDIVVSANVIEHVRKVWVWIKEVARVCKAGGRVITLGPVSHPCHRAPYDCWRIYPDGMRTLYEEAGLKMDVCRCQSLEYTGRRRMLPGISGVDAERPHVLKDAIKNWIRFPIECAFDTIAIGTKIQG